MVASLAVISFWRETASGALVDATEMTSASLVGRASLAVQRVLSDMIARL